MNCLYEELSTDVRGYSDKGDPGIRVNFFDMVMGLSFPGENRRTQVDQLQGEGGSLLLLCQAKLS